MRELIISVIKTFVKTIWAYRDFVRPTLHNVHDKCSRNAYLNVVATPIIALLLLKLVFYWRGKYILVTRKNKHFGKRVTYLPEFSAHSFHRYIVYPEHLIGYGSHYMQDGFLPEEDDIAIDVGTYLGRDAVALSKYAKQVISFEPSPRNLEYAKKNLREFDNIELVNKGLWYETGELELRYGQHPSDDSFIEPDVVQEDEVRYLVPTDTIANIMEKRNIDEIGFLKIEAEDAEPEIVEGIKGANVRKVIVNTGSERKGEYTHDPVVEHLESYGYEILRMSSKARVFAVKK